MTENQSNRQRPWEESADRDQVTFGTWLRRQREIREIPLREIADVTKISIRYLEALEQDRFDILPAPVFARGFLREYSKYVGLDPDEVVNSYLSADSAGAEEEGDGGEEAGGGGRSASRWPVLAGIVALIVLLGLIYVVARFWPRDRADVPPPIAAPVSTAPVTPSPVAAEPAVVASPVAQVRPEPTAPLVVTMDFTEDCWVEVEVDGERRLSELHVQGESMRLEGQEAVRLTLGNPGGVHLEVNGQVYELDYTRGRVARDVEIDLELARTLGNAAG